MAKENLSRIESVEDLIDERAKNIALEHNLDVKEILPKYLELLKEAEENKGHIEIDINNPNTPLNAHEIYKRKLACGAVISYEFTKREILSILVSEVPVSINLSDEGSLLFGTLKGKGHICRTAPIEIYEKMGFIYQQLIARVTDSQKDALDNL